MNDQEKWYQFCMRCIHSYRRKDDADTVYCEVDENHCPYRNEIEFSMKQAGKEVRQWITEKYEQFGYNLGKAGEEE